MGQIYAQMSYTIIANKNMNDPHWDNAEEIKMKYGLNEETYNSIKEIVKKNAKYKFKIFGSRAKGTYKSNSDIDIAIFENVTQEDKFKIKNEIDELNIIYKIDLVFIEENIKKELLESIKEGVEI